MLEQAVKSGSDIISKIRDIETARSKYNQERLAKGKLPISGIDKRSEYVGYLHQAGIHQDSIRKALETEAKGHDFVHAATAFDAIPNLSVKDVNTAIAVGASGTLLAPAAKAVNEKNGVGVEKFLKLGALNTDLKSSDADSIFYTMKTLHQFNGTRSIGDFVKNLPQLRKVGLTGESIYHAARAFFSIRKPITVQEKITLLKEAAVITQDKTQLPHVVKALAYPDGQSAKEAIVDAVKAGCKGRLLTKIMLLLSSQENYSDEEVHTLVTIMSKYPRYDAKAVLDALRTGAKEELVDAAIKAGVSHNVLADYAAVRHADETLEEPRASIAATIYQRYKESGIGLRSIVKAVKENPDADHELINRTVGVMSSLLKEQQMRKKSPFTQHGDYSRLHEAVGTLTNRHLKDLSDEALKTAMKCSKRGKLFETALTLAVMHGTHADIDDSEMIQLAKSSSKDGKRLPWHYLALRDVDTATADMLKGVNEDRIPGFMAAKMHLNELAGADSTGEILERVKQLPGKILAIERALDKFEGLSAKDLPFLYLAFSTVPTDQAKKMWENGFRGTDFYYAFQAFLNYEETKRASATDALEAIITERNFKGRKEGDKGNRLLEKTAACHVGVDNLASAYHRVQHKRVRNNKEELIYEAYHILLTGIRSNKINTQRLRTQRRHLDEAENAINTYWGLNETTRS